MIEIRAGEVVTLTATKAFPVDVHAATQVQVGLGSYTAEPAAWVDPTVAPSYSDDGKTLTLGAKLGNGFLNADRTVYLWFNVLLPDGQRYIEPYTYHRLVFVGTGGSAPVSPPSGTVTSVSVNEGTPATPDSNGNVDLQVDLGAQDAADVTFAPAGPISATDVQAAVEEVSTQAASAVSDEAVARASGDSSTLTSANNYTDGKITDLVGAAPEALDTLAEIDAQLAADEGSAAALAATVAGKLDKAQNLADVQDPAEARDNIGALGAADAAPLSNSTPQPLGTASPGTATDASRSDHVHENPLSSQYLGPIRSFKVNEWRLGYIQTGTLTTYVSGDLVLAPIAIPVDFTLDGLACAVGSAATGGTVRAVMFTDNNGTPGTGIADTGAQSATVVGAKGATGLNVARTRGLYWAGVLAESVTGTLKIESVGLPGGGQAAMMPWVAMPHGTGSLPNVSLGNDGIVASASGISGSQLAAAFTGALATDHSGNRSIPCVWFKFSAVTL